MSIFLSPHELAARPDSELLAEFLASRRSEPLAEVVRRHARLMHMVARRITGSADDAEDVVQTTCMLLARHAKQLASGRDVAPWVYQVARRAALDCLKARVRRLARETQYARDRLQESMHMAEQANPSAPPEPGVFLALHEAVHALPSKCQAAVILCHFENLTQQEAALRLGYSQRSVSGWLNKAYIILRRRLTDRGVAVSVAGVTALLSAEGAFAASIPPQVILASAAAAHATGAAAVAGGVSPGAALLTKSVGSTLAWLHGLKVGALAITVALAAGTALVVHHRLTSPGPAKLASDGARGVPFHFEVNPAEDPTAAGMELSRYASVYNDPMQGREPGHPRGLRAHFISGDNSRRFVRLARPVAGRLVFSAEVEATIYGVFAPDVPVGAPSQGVSVRLVGIAAPEQAAPATQPAGARRNAYEHTVRWVLTETAFHSGRWKIAQYTDGELVEEREAAGLPTVLGIEITGEPGSAFTVAKFGVRGRVEPLPPSSSSRPASRAAATPVAGG